MVDLVEMVYSQDLLETTPPPRVDTNPLWYKTHQHQIPNLNHYNHQAQLGVLNNESLIVPSSSTKSSQVLANDHHSIAHSKRDV